MTPQRWRCKGRARTSRRLGVTNIRLSDPLNDPLPQQPTFDLVTTFDVVHDTPYPDRLISDIYGALKPESYWLCEDIRGFETFNENLQNHPMAGLLYGFSVMVCMNSGMSTEDGAGLGTSDLPAKSLRK